MNQTPHPTDALQDLLSGRLSGEERQRVEEHLSSCGQCRAEWERLRATRALLRHFAESEEVPRELAERVGAALDADQRRRRGRPARLGWAIAAGLTLVIGLIVVARVARRDLPAAAVADYRAVSTGKISLQLRTGDAAQLNQWFDQQLGFPSRVFDLGMMRYQLLGGRVDELAGRRSALFVYRHEGGELVICEMFEAVSADLPSGAEHRGHNGFDFLIYERDDTTAVFWQEGTVLCVLVSSGNREDLIALAFAKAMRPSQPS